MTNQDREEEARAALRRMEQQSEKIITGSHSGDTQEDDKIEMLGKRIARIISIILAVGLIVYLWRTYLS